MTGIFISYRRDDSAGWTGRLATDLQTYFGRETVFQDIEAIPAGEDFIHVIERSLGSCSVVLVVIGPEWTHVRDESGARRLDNPEDTVRLEVGKALAWKGRLVIPVLVGGARIPKAPELPEELKALAGRNAFELSDTRWVYDCDQLAASLIKNAGLIPKPPTTPSGPKPLRWLTALGSFMFILVALLVGYWHFVPPVGLPNPIIDFEITQPSHGEELRLGKNQTWMVEGVLRLAATPEEISTGGPDLSIDVIKLPDRQPVEQKVKPYISNRSNKWLYNYVFFDGEGLYEIIVKVLFKGISDYQEIKGITVTFLPTESDQSMSLLRNSAVFGTASFQTQTDRVLALSNLQSYQIIPRHLDCLAFQKDYENLKQQTIDLGQKLIQTSPLDPDWAKTYTTQILGVLDQIIPFCPDNLDLRNLRASTLINYALVMRNHEEPEEFNLAIKRAQRELIAILQQPPEKTDTWNELGRIAFLRNDLNSVVFYNERALEIDPDNSVAQQDLTKAQWMLEQKKGSGD